MKNLVNYDALYELMLEQIRNYARLALEEQEQLMELLMQKTADCRAERKKYQEIKIYYRFVGEID